MSISNISDQYTISSLMFNSIASQQQNQQTVTSNTNQGADTVNISSEAMAMYQAMQAEQSLATTLSEESTSENTEESSLFDLLTNQETEPNQAMDGAPKGGGGGGKPSSSDDEEEDDWYDEWLEAMYENDESESLLTDFVDSI